MRAQILVKDVPPIRVLATHLNVTGQAEILASLRELRPRVADVLAGPAMALRLGFPRDGKVDVEVAFPVSDAIERDGFVSKTLPGLPMFSITHRGPVVGGPEGTNLIDTRKALVEFVNETGVLLGDDPERFLYHEGAETHGDRAEFYLTEVQYSYHLPMWLAALRDGVAREVGSDAAHRVMAGSCGLVEALDGERAAAWVRGAMDRLDREVPSEPDRARIMNACAHHYIVQSAMLVEAAFRETGKDLRRLVAKITEEKLLGSQYWIDESGPEPLLMIRRRPARPDEVEKAATPEEKRYEACFCPLVRDALRKGESVSRTFCHCSGGWYAQEWAVVFGEAPEVRLVETMLEGKDACVFAVVIPDGWLK
ncbi:MAG: hypothetical protein AB1778_02690 [Candidatus Bipolaricaulota bacterium]